MSEDILCSVIVPVYNVEKYLPRCMDSLLQQTLKNIEIICIDDGSTDGSGSMLDEYAQKDNRVRVIHKVNGGYGQAMNTGLQYAVGKYIGIVESDDFAAPEMFEKLCSTAEQHHAQIVKSNFYKYWAKPKEKAVKEPLLQHLPYHQVIHPWAYQRLFRIQPSIWSGVYLRSFIEENYIHFLETPGAAYQDTSFTFKLFAMAERVVLLPEALLYYRQDNENSSIHSAEKALFICEEYGEINQLLNQKQSYSVLHEIRNQSMYHTYLWNYVRLSKDLCQQFLYQMQLDFLQLQQAGQLSMSDYSKADWKMLAVILDNPDQFLQKERLIMPLRKKVPNKMYRALLIGRIAGIGTMMTSIVRRLMRK